MNGPQKGQERMARSVASRETHSLAACVIRQSAAGDDRKPWTKQRSVTGIRRLPAKDHQLSTD